MQKRSTTAGSEIPASLRRYLYFTASVTGAAIMIVEILGAKMLSPYIGTSHFVWTAQIAVTLVALAAGYYVGGKLVDQSPKLPRLYAAILIAALYLAGTVAVVRPVAYWCLNFKLAVGSLLASGFLFFIPLALLAMVCPFLIRVLAVSISGVGGSVGRLTAISTLGSFVGTVLIGYLLIPFFPNSVTMYGTSVVLFAIATGYYLGWARGRARNPVLAAGLILVGLGLMARQMEDFRMQTFIERFRGNSNFGLLQVLETRDGARRYYLNDYLTQNTYDPVEKKSISMFTFMLHLLPRAYTTNIENVLCIGLGVGIVPMEFAAEGVSVDVVEINPAVVPLGQRFFGLNPTRLNIIIGDGRYYVNQSRKKYDAVVLDAFLGESSPSHLMSREAFDAMRRVLKPGGVLVINSFGDFESGKDFFTASLEKTLKASFRSVLIHTSGGGNVLFVASDRDQLTILRPPNFEGVHAQARSQVEAAFKNIVQSNPLHGRVLTDDFNPVEFYDAANRERTRRQLALAMRGRGEDLPE